MQRYYEHGESHAASSEFGTCGGRSASGGGVCASLRSKGRQMAEMTIAPDTVAQDLGVAHIPEVELVKGTGWLPDWPDHRDYTAEHPQLRLQLESLGAVELADPSALPLTVDLRPWFSPIEDQGALGSCTANAGMGALEYFERRAF